MAHEEGIAYKITVEGSQKAATDLAVVEAGFQKIQRAAALSATASPIDKSSVAELAKGVKLSESSIIRLIDSMRNVEKERAFRQLADDAGLSHMQLARLRARMGDARGAVASLGQAVAASKVTILAFGAALLYAGKAALDAQVQMQRLEQSYKAVFGSGAGAQLQTVYAQTDRVGLKFVETAEAAKSFFAAGQSTSLAPNLNAIFTAVTNAGAGLQLSTEQINGTFVALGQMISKGKVQAEELRGQLGERLPGAFQMAAKAMGMTTAELDKFMADGKLTAEELLPKLARALEEKYGQAAENAAQTIQGSINRMETEWERFKAGLLDSGPAVFTIRIVTEWLKEKNDVDALAKANADIDAKLAARGIKPAGRRNNYLSDTAESIAVYTEEQREPIRIEERQAALVQQWEDKQAREEEKTISAMREAINRSLKDTTAHKFADATRQRDAALKAIREGINFAKKDGKTDSSTIAGLEADYAAAENVWNEKINSLQNKTGKAAASAARSASVAQADYTGELERTHQQIESLQQQLELDKSESFAREKIRIEQAYQATISKTSEELAKQVARGSMSQAQADTLRAEKEKAANLQRQLSLREAGQRAEEKAGKHLQARVDFYRDLAALSGDYGTSIALQNQLLEKQAQNWLAAGISVDDVRRRVELMRQDMARDPLSGLARGLRKFGADFGDTASQVEGLVTQMGNTISNTLANAFMKGKFSAQDFFNSLVGMAAQAASNYFIGMLFKGLGGLFSRGPSLSGAGMEVFNSSIGPAFAEVRHSGGIVGSATAHMRSIPLSVFAGAPRFHGGGGFLRHDERAAILQTDELVLNRAETRAYMAGKNAASRQVFAAHATPGSTHQQIIINFVDKDGNRQQQTVRNDGNSNMTIDVLLNEIDKGLAQRVSQGKSQTARALDASRGLNSARQLYN